jgi:hypothetical protein
MTDIARMNGDLVAMTYRALKEGVGGVKNAKELLKLLIVPTDHNGQLLYPWQHFRVLDQSGCVIDDVTRNPPKTFREFVESKPLRGLGEKLEDIQRLLADDAEAIVQLRRLTVGEHGGDRKSEEIKTDNISLDSDLFASPKPHKKKADAGNSRAYTLTRLESEHPDLFERVISGELSAHAAAKLAGIVKPVSGLDALRRAWGRASDEERQAFLSLVGEAPTLAESGKMATTFLEG